MLAAQMLTVCVVFSSFSSCRSIFVHHHESNMGVQCDQKPSILTKKDKFA